MSITLRAEAISELRPNAKWIMYGEDITWQDEEQTQPSESEISKKITELESLQSIKELRSVRNNKLTETDWVVIKEREEGGSVSNFADWKEYRQKLRDITNTYKSLEDVKWPTAPSE